METAQSHTFYAKFYENPSEVPRIGERMDTKSQSTHDTQTHYAKHYVQ